MPESTAALLAQVQQGQHARILRRPEVEQRTGLSRSAIYAAMASGHFPRPLKLTAKAVGWLESSVEAWIARRAAVTAQ